MVNQPSKLKLVGVEHIEEIKKKKISVPNLSVKTHSTEKLLYIGRFVNKLSEKLTFAIRDGLNH